MRKIYIVMIGLFIGSFSALYAQETSSAQIEKPADKAFIDFKIKQLTAKKEALIAAEKEALKLAVLEIEKRLDKGDISLEMAAALKDQAAQLRAENIASRSAIIDLEIELLRRNNGDLVQAKTTFDDLEEGVELSIDVNGKPFKFFKEREVKYDRRTYSDFVVTMGINNLVNFDQDIEGVDDVDFQLAGSRFLEIGWEWRTRLFERSNFLRLNYGIMFQYNGLKPKHNQYVTILNGETQLATFDQDLKKSKFRVDNLVLPVHIEFGRSNKSVSSNKIRYLINDSFRVGVGGYAGVNLSSRQKLKYSQNGERVKEKLKQGYDVNDFVYGLSAYAGRGGTQLYAKYDLSPMFASGPIKGNNISLGLRFDL